MGLRNFVRRQRLKVRAHESIEVGRIQAGVYGHVRESEGVERLIFGNAQACLGRAERARASALKYEKGSMAAEKRLKHAKRYEEAGKYLEKIYEKYSLELGKLKGGDTKNRLALTGQYKKMLEDTLAKFEREPTGEG